jgi:hypothetical protein
LSKFSKDNFKLILQEIEKMQAANENINVPIGILERMYDDYQGYIDNYFYEKKIDPDTLYDQLEMSDGKKVTSSK